MARYGLAPLGCCAAAVFLGLVMNARDFCRTMLGCLQRRLTGTGCLILDAATTSAAVNRLQASLTWPCITLSKACNRWRGHLSLEVSQRVGPTLGFRRGRQKGAESRWRSSESRWRGRLGRPCPSSHAGRAGAGMEPPPPSWSGQAGVEWGNPGTMRELCWS